MSPLYPITTKLCGSSSFLLPTGSRLIIMVMMMMM